MHTVEPVIGNIKFNLGYRYFLLRGLHNVKGEFNLMCIAHNLKKIASFLTKSGTDIALALENVKEILKIKRNRELCIAC